MTEIKKMKITVFRTNYYEDLMAEYGAEGLGVCELHAPGRSSTPTAGRNPPVSVTTPGNVCRTMFSHAPCTAAPFTARASGANRTIWSLSAAMTASARSSSKWKEPMRRQRSLKRTDLSESRNGVFAVPVLYFSEDIICVMIVSNAMMRKDCPSGAVFLISEGGMNWLPCESSEAMGPNR